MLNPENRKLIKGKCSYCNKEIEKREIHFKLCKKHYCSTQCLSADRKTGDYFACGFCGKEIWRTKSQIARSKSGRVFCGKACTAKFSNTFYKSGENHPRYVNGVTGYRSQALKYYGIKCMNLNCELLKNNIIVPEELLDVHHKDGDRMNNKLENLEVLCVYCHAKRTRKIDL